VEATFGPLLEALDDALRARGRAEPTIEERLKAAYRGDPEAAGLCEAFVDVDEGLQEWRYRHVKMVERTIGTKPGTGGSSGAEYLRGTLFRPAFPPLWTIRAEL
jgi:tryptophan 2,3-dioxygenase